MDKNIAHTFFSALALVYTLPVRVIVIGGAASQIVGGTRPTLDVDFEVALLDKLKKWEDFEEAIRLAEKKTGIASQFSQNIDRWSQISYLDYLNHIRLYKKYQKIEVFILEPIYWSIGKITRYFDWDIQDMIEVFKKENVNPLELEKIWHQAIQKSPKSTELFLVKKNAAHFFKTFGTKIWGKAFLTTTLVYFN